MIRCLGAVARVGVDLHINANTVAKVYAGPERASVLTTPRGIRIQFHEVMQHLETLDTRSTEQI
jgi:DNA-binding transcriptional regulator YhcF (GntR family)